MASTQTDLIQTQHVTNETSPVTVKNRVAFDGGNRFVKWFDGNGNPQKIPSYIKELMEWEATPAHIDPQSVLIECESRRFIVGQLAKELGGSPTFRHDKSELARDLVLVALEPDEGSNQVLIECLAIATPDTNHTESMRRLQRLKATRAFKRNGVDVTAMVRKVEAIDEGLTAWRFAYTHGIFQYAQNNAVLDLGGGTGIGRIITPSGNVIQGANVIVPGTSALASMIAAALKSKENFTPDTDLIMDAIENGNMIYPTESGSIPFENIFLHCRKQWLSDIRSKLKEAWVSQLNKIGEILIIGGSAGLAQELDGRGRYKIARYGNVSNFHQLVSLYGLAEEM